ncbi:RNA ligase family protein [Erwinia pyrifoliae]|uniref:RNA ligase family protein n=1 Tax=Erwinia pyrifoliae TaxID=79967 RepID=A0ABY5XCL0_ERWPY|nr:RNA ligase family protein [Erwinia pyrifoliae]AUX72686.1 hypothetical protein CPI84_09470 [Erwinia pyrifoliae]MCA8877051.1 hypothetical protein [Erwinia pyrifoliae]UWS35145.1 RNA ligase family protein [Erwinia pyrifoliae]UXK14044.1 RNA ligase family protein [Erwinia pyrifoliae]CAX55610.1 uncharacterized protein EpC_18310 [Erwinia pyrifoliae Ep1/96]
MLPGVSAGIPQVTPSTTNITDNISRNGEGSKVLENVLGTESTNTEFHTAKSSQETTFLHYPEIQRGDKAAVKLINFVNDGTLTENVKIEGTVKLDGRNSSVAVDFRTGKMWGQTRKHVIDTNIDPNIDPKKDPNKGFMLFVNDGKINDIFKKSFEQINKHKLSGENHAAIFGEWCGVGVMDTDSKDFAINKLKPLFVVFDIAFFKEGSKKGNKARNQECRFLPAKIVNDIITSARNGGQRNSSDNDPSTAQERVFCTNEFETYELTINPLTFQIEGNISAGSSKFLRHKVPERLLEITNDIIEQCPVAHKLGQKGRGEGAVWRVVSDNPKTNGLMFKVSETKDTESKAGNLPPEQKEKINSKNVFITTFLTKERMEKVWSETPKNRVSQPIFCQAVKKNIGLEQPASVEASGLKTKEIHKIITSVAGDWYMQHQGNEQK